VGDFDRFMRSCGPRGAGAVRRRATTLDGAGAALGRRGRGGSGQPAVGCVIVRDGRVVGRGWTADGGGPCGGVALAQAGRRAGGTAYVTLEPCAHRGRGARAPALVAAGVARVVADGDPDPGRRAGARDPARGGDRGREGVREGRGAAGPRGGSCCA
jgi:diaminohydroxyphosphoribosylaminopyrimidine deaminase/5-amino-6-(5-phosphoribosylamino)uracil reductase